VLRFRYKVDRLIGEGEQMDGASREIGCPECVELLADYIDGSLPQDQIAQLEWHLDGCPPCVAFVNTYKGTVNAARRLREQPETNLPAELRQKLIAFLKRSDASRS
jgi:anti-sigma factor RsiW